MFSRSVFLISFFRLVWEHAGINEVKEEEEKDDDDDDVHDVRGDGLQIEDYHNDEVG